MNNLANPFSHPQTQLLARSLNHWTGRNLLPGDFSPAEFAEKVFQAPFVLVSHGTETDPVLNYGNQSALTLWEMSWAELTRTPSRFTAEAPNRENVPACWPPSRRAVSLTIIPVSGYPKVTLISHRTGHCLEPAR